MEGDGGIRPSLHLLRRLHAGSGPFREGINTAFLMKERCLYKLILLILFLFFY